jgi:hypothetical protein
MELAYTVNSEMDETIYTYWSNLSYSEFTKHLGNTHKLTTLQITTTDGIEITELNFSKNIVDCPFLNVKGAIGLTRASGLKRKAQVLDQPTIVLRSLSTETQQSYKKFSPDKNPSYVVDPNFAQVVIPGIPSYALQELSCIFDTGNGAKTIISKKFSDLLLNAQSSYPELIYITDNVPPIEIHTGLSEFVTEFNSKVPEGVRCKPSLLFTPAQIKTIFSKGQVNNFRKGDKVIHRGRRALVIESDYTKLANKEITLLYYEERRMGRPAPVPYSECEFEEGFKLTVQNQFLQVEPGIEFRNFTAEYIYNTLGFGETKPAKTSFIDVLHYLETNPPMIKDPGDIILTEPKSEMKNIVQNLLNLRSFSGVVKDAQVVAGFQIYTFPFFVKGMEHNLPGGFLHIEAYCYGDTDILFNATTMRTLALFNVNICASELTSKHHSLIASAMEEKQNMLIEYKSLRFLNKPGHANVLATIHMQHALIDSLQMMKFPAQLIK